MVASSTIIAKEATHYNPKTGTNTPEITEFDRLVLQAEKDVVDLTAPSDLFHSESFVKIYENPTIYTKEAIEFLKDKEKSITQKQIVVYSLQSLP
jgi:hypothetical protein